MKDIYEWASYGPFDNVAEEVFGPVYVNDVLAKLQEGDAIFVDCLRTLGSTQENLVQVLEQLLAHDILVYVMNPCGPSKLTHVTLAYLKAFRQLDITSVHEVS